MPTRPEPDNQFMPPGAAGPGGTTSGSIAPSPSRPTPAGTTPGVGLSVADGTPTAWRTPGSSRLNTAHDPFSPVGSLAVSRFGPEWAGRYTGGDVSATYATPLAGAEWEPQLAGAMIEWFRAGRPAEGLPSGVTPAPGSFDGTPVDRERVDLSYHPEAFSFIAEWLWTRSPNREGKTAETPLPVSRPDLPWAYFTEPHVQYPATVYFRNTARPPGEVSYSPARRQKNHIDGREFGPRLQPYPQVFGEPTQPTPPVQVPTQPPIVPELPIDTGTGGGNTGGSGQPSDELATLRRDNSLLRSDLTELERLLDEIEAEARTFRDGLPTAGGGRPMNQLRNETRKLLSRIMALAEKRARGRD